MPVMTPKQVLMQNLNRLVANERVLVAELRRLEHGLASVRAQIEVERRALAGEQVGAEPDAGQHAA